MKMRWMWILLLLPLLWLGCDEDEIDEEEELKGLSYEDQCMKILDNIFINGSYKLIKIT